MKNFDDVIKQVARKNKTTAKNVRREMEIAIDYSWQHNLKIRELFNSKPTPEQFIARGCIEIKRKMDGNT